VASELFKSREFVSFLASDAVDRLAASGLTVLLGFQIYTVTQDPLNIGWLGLVEAVPGVTLVLYGGDVADRYDRRWLVIWATALMACLAGCLAVASAGATPVIPTIYAVSFLLACSKAFRGPAASGLEAQVLPRHLALQGVPLLATSGRVADVLGPVVAGFAWAAFGPVATYAGIGALLLFGSGLVAFGVRRKPFDPKPSSQGTAARILEGVRYVFRDPVLVGSMALDLFAVFFAGVTALLPVFATDILHSGPEGFGVLRSAMAAGAMVAALGATRILSGHRAERAGRALHGVIASFALCIIVFGLSRNIYVSIAALFCAGLCDGVSMVIRHAILRLASPAAMRGRISAVRSVFVGSSNELGSLESGFAAALLGTANAVCFGGVATLVVVALVGWRAPELWRLNLQTLSPRPPEEGPPVTTQDLIETEEFPKLASSG
jgi:MFS family permease